MSLLEKVWACLFALMYWIIDHPFACGWVCGVATVFGLCDID